jgi:hypothetical protein
MKKSSLIRRGSCGAVLFAAFWGTAACLCAQGGAGPASRWEADIVKMETADRTAPPPSNAVLLAGSSSVRMWAGAGKTLPGVPLINRGFGGSCIPDNTFYADRIIIPCRPRIIFLYAGDNDLAAGVTPDQVLADYRAFVAEIRKKLPDTPVVFMAIKPSPARRHLMEHMREANAKIRAFTAAAPHLGFLDTFSPLLDAAGAPRPELYMKDGLHLNAQGYAIWEALLHDELKARR